ncbi:hypothetical protein TMatcc_003784 [Talaromyces marneffei ATCC 18224]|nr:uncharacterized protein EYB26_001212 [Talaromyces marneffei]KAE8556420.1 hypothetical protein EYB25_001121 [Talaromyces marneffei]QGA13562.1 hypothetical protein EYB26_001212 [Talaromyces marneffei]
MTSAKEIYHSLSSIFANRKSDEVLEIEILTPESGPLLQDGLCIGITKAALVKAFLIARQKLTRYLTQLKENTVNGGLPDESDEANELSIATQIILLFDCEHVTACNWRKRYISSSMQQYDNQYESRHLEDLLQRETTLLSSFQCSPLHRHTKSPTLWQHRLWIMGKLLNLKEQNAMAYDPLCRLILKELDVVCKSGQLHPRNYYAFSYMRQLHALVCRYSSSKEGVSREEVLGDGSQALLLDLAILMIEPVLKWCLSNPSDISGWMYLFYLLDCDRQMMNSPSMQEDRMIAERIVVMKRTIQFAVHIATWEGESLWTFVDLMLARFGNGILPTADIARLELANSLPTSGARWKTTKLGVYKTYEGMRDESIS